MKRGDIVYGKKNLVGGHPIIYLADNDSHSFVGAMLTKAGGYEGNSPMSIEHFREVDSNGKPFSFKFKSTHLVGQTLLKKLEWEPFEKVGELSEEGLKFVENYLLDKEPVFWENYLNDQRT